MAVVNVKSAQITNRDATPRVLNDAAVSGTPVRNARAVVAITNADSVGSTYRLFELPSNAIVSEIRVSSPDIGTTTAADLGLYETVQNGGAVVDADFFENAISLNGGALARADQTFGNIITIANFLSRLWQLVPGSLTRDPIKKYDVVLTLTGAADATGSVLVECEYTE